MSYKSDFGNDTGWSAVDTNIKLDTTAGKKFRDYLKTHSVKTIIRYYASTNRPKTLSVNEAKVISDDGFNLLPVFQDRNRLPGDFGPVNGRNNARSAMAFAAEIGQPPGTTILFAADADFSTAETNSFILPYFEEVKNTIGTGFRIGAYGSGLVLQNLLDEELIEVPWISMSRGFRGTKEFFYGNDWAFRQVPPDRTHGETDITHDVNVLKWTPADIGVFRLSGAPVVAGMAAHPHDATLGGGLAEAAPAAPAVANAYTTTEGVNFRASPDGQIIRELTICQPLNDLGPSPVDGWQKVQIDGQDGFVFGKYVRQPLAPEIEALLRSVVSEWVRFDKGQAHEATDPFYRYVGEMWASIGLTYDGRSLYPNGEEVPWSAAFISYVVRRAHAAYANFKFDQSHSKFSHDAIQARILGRMNRPFWGYRRTEKKPELGDIIHRNRGPGTFTYDYAENHSEFKSHSDIVVEVTSHVVRVIGGNVGDTVSMRDINSAGDNIQEYVLDANGFIAAGQRVIALLKNRAKDVS